MIAAGVTPDLADDASCGTPTTSDLLDLRPARLPPHRIRPHSHTTETSADDWPNRQAIDLAPTSVNGPGPTCAPTRHRQADNLRSLLAPSGLRSRSTSGPCGR